MSVVRFNASAYQSFSPCTHYRAQSPRAQGSRYCDVTSVVTGVAARIHSLGKALLVG